MLNILKRKTPQFFSAEQQQQIVAAIQKAEKTTSGEIRLYVESHCSYVDAIDRAEEIFSKLNMYATRQRNAVLLYVALKDKQLALYGDSGIYNHAGKAYWDSGVKTMIAHFNRDSYAEGIVQVITEIGQTLSQAFPYSEGTDKNELPDDIVYGK
ncbi:MAG TPA: TPM domain-containing protein [Arachidicoccus sp.]